MEANGRNTHIIPTPNVWYIDELWCYFSIISKLNQSISYFSYLSYEIGAAGGLMCQDWRRQINKLRRQKFVSARKRPNWGRNEDNVSEASADLRFSADSWKWLTPNNQKLLRTAATNIAPTTTRQCEVIGDLMTKPPRIKSDTVIT